MAKFFLTIALVLHAFPLSIAQELPRTKSANSLTSTADQITAKYATAIGGPEAWQKVTSLVTHATVAIPEIHTSGTMDVFERSPDRNLTIMRLGHDVSAVGFDGRNGWATDPQHGFRRMSGAELANIKNDARFYREIEIQQIFKMTSAGVRRLGTARAYVLTSSTSGENPITMYFDLQTGLKLRTDFIRAGPEGTYRAEARFSDYREVKPFGIKVPFRIEEKAAKLTEIISITSVEANVPIDDKEFEH